MFGCQSGTAVNSVENAENLQKAVDYAVKSGKKLISTGGKAYYIGKEVVINGPVNIDLGMASVVATDTITMMSISYKLRVGYNGAIKGIVFNMNKKAKCALRSQQAIKMHISECDINNVPKNGCGIAIESGYEMMIDNIHILGGEDYATGIRINTSDCHFSDCVIINCKTAIYNFGSNIYDRIHAWIGNKGEWLRGSTFFCLKGGDCYLNQCCSDTYDTAFEFQSNGIVMINQLKHIQNPVMWNEKHADMHPTVFRFNNASVNRTKVYVTNSVISGIKYKNIQKQQLTNMSKGFVEYSGTVISL